MICNAHPHHAENSRSVLSSREPPEAQHTLAREALRELLAANHYSMQVGRDVWEFAVTVHELRTAGLSESDLRWLVCEEMVRHACEVTRLGDHARQFQPMHPLVFTQQDYVVLKERGCDFECSLLTRNNWPEFRPVLASISLKRSSCNSLSYSNNRYLIRPLPSLTRHTAGT